MPRKTKEQKELEDKKEEKNKSVKATATAKKSTAKKATTTTKKATAKKTTTTAKKSTAKKTTTTAKKSTAKKTTATAKKSTAKKTTTTAKKSTAKKTTTTAKKSTAKKTTTTAKKSTAKKTTATAKKATAKKATATAKKSTAKKTTATAKRSTPKKTTATAKKATTKKVTAKTKKESLLDPTLEVAEYYDLPFRYNQTVVKILAQTPSTLFIYWEISDEDIENYKKQYGNNFFEVTKPVLIVHNLTLDYSFEIDINDFANSWYLRVNNSKCEYKIELGRRPLDNYERFERNYIYVATSNQIENPNDHILLEDFPDEIRFRNVKDQSEFTKKVSDLSIGKNIRKIYDIYDLYKLIYQDENVDDIFDLSNPTSGGNPSSGDNPSSGSFYTSSPVYR